jgi:hypothetical protein
MPVRYDVNSKLNVVIYVCRGEISAADLFKATDLVYLDPRRKPGLIFIYDLLFAVENLHLKDMYEIIEKLERAIELRLEVGPVVLLTRSKGLHIFVKTMKLLPKKVPIQIDAYYTIEDAIVALGLVDSQQEIIRFWRECESLYS